LGAGPVRTGPRRRALVGAIFFLEFGGGQVEAGIIYLVVLGSIVGTPFAFRARKKAQLRKAPSGSRQTVSVKVMTVEDAIRRWGRLGYDLHERTDYEASSVSPASSVTRIAIPEVRARLTFIKR
jgi:hypothetical protein